MGIEPTPSHLRCAALPVELPSPLGARWWGVGYTNVSFLGANYILNTKFSDEHPSGDMLSPLALGWMLHVYPTPHHLAPSGLGSSTGRAAHRRCEGVGSIPTQVLRFFLQKKVLGLVYKCYWFEFVM